MKFRFKPVQSFEDAQGNFEQLEQLAGLTTFLAASNNLSDIANITTALNNLGIRWGSGTVTWPGAATNSAVLTVTHSLGRTPAAVVTGPKFSSASFLSFVVTIQNVTTTTFTAWGGAVNGTPGAGETGVFYWAVIG